MTDPTDSSLPLDPLDDLASAALDGEHGDDAVGAPTRARMDELRVASELVATPVEPLDDGPREAMLSAALAAFDDADDGDGASETNDGPAVVDLAPRRAVRGRRRIWLPPPAAAAAAVVVIALIGIGLILSDDRSGSINTAAKAPSGALAHGNATAEDAAAPATGGSELPDLGTFADEKALATTLRSEGAAALFSSLGDPAASTTAPGTSAAAGDTSTTLAPGTTRGSNDQGSAPQASTPDRLVQNASIQRCDVAIRATDPSLGERATVVAATVGGRPVLVYDHPVEGAEGATTATRLTIADLETCGILLAVQR